MSVRQTLRAFHRWLGAGLCLLFLTWFASGIVMTFAGFPSVGEREKLAHAAALRAESLRTQPATALAGLATDAEAIELHALGERALYTVRSGGRTRAVFADTGERPSELDGEALSTAASRWVHGATLDRTRLSEVDQWTPQADRHGALPCLRFSARDADATELYLSLVDGQVLQRTTAQSRFLAWIGAIPHWIYPILLRRHEGAWRALVIALSGLGAVASTSGASSPSGSRTRTRISTASRVSGTTRCAGYRRSWRNENPNINGVRATLSGHTQRRPGPGTSASWVRQPLA